MERRSITREILFWGILGIMFCAVVYAAILATWPYDPIRIDSFTVDKSIVRPGEIVTFHFVGEKFYDISPTISIDLVNGEHFHIMDYPGTNPKGKIDNTRTFIIPRVPPRNYKLTWSATYPINAFASPRRKVETDWITVLPDDHPEKGERGIKGDKGDKGDRGKDVWGLK